MMVDGSTRKIEFEDTLGFYQMSSAVVANLNGDGQDDVLMPVNYVVRNKFQMKFFHNTIMTIGFSENVAVELDLHNEGSNISSTPWIGDLDNNGYLDIVYIQGTNVKETYTFEGFTLTELMQSSPLGAK